MFKNKKVRNWLFAVIAVAVIAVVTYLLLSPADASDSTAPTQGKVVALEVSQTIETSGTLDAQPFASLTWKTSGVVESVNVQPGDLVQAGDVLLALQPSSTSASIVAAQADLINAQEKLEDLVSSGTALAQAEIDLKKAQEEYDDAVYYLKYLQNDDRIPQTEYSAKLVSNNRNGWTYEYELNNFKGPAPQEWIDDAEDDVALKKGQLEDAQREYDRLLAGEESTAVLAARAEVEAAQVTINSLFIVAPFDGKVLSVDDVVGDLVDANTTSVNIADMNHLYVAAQVDESDVANVKTGQRADITLDALSDVTLTGKVAAINPVGEEESGLVKYTVQIYLDQINDQAFIPLGTTANVTIHISDALSSLAVPIATIQNDASGEFVMVLQSDGSTKRVDIVSSEIVGDLVTVVGELKEGDVLMISQTSGAPSSGPFGGGD
ncbi:MAG: efflux RND transporter periplasmic adaptor subunit [Anaerolineae bacterium]|nr:efflux RND transporter periplasmic adaptor subunit [Anaerolineae bacterium]